MTTSAARHDSFYTSLSCGALGHQVPFEDAIELAVEFGFGGVEPNLAHLHGLAENERTQLADRLAERGLRWGSAGLPVSLVGDAATFAEQLARLPQDAATLRAAGVRRVGTWIKPMSDTLTYPRQLARYAERIALVDEILAPAGLRFGLEYVGPKTVWATGRFPFVHTLTEARELLAAVGSDNVGLVLDSYHWYTAGETLDDLRRLSVEQIVAADINDAPLGLHRDEQLDLDRELPGKTGVIDLDGFLGVLRELGYIGPLKVEPFSKELGELSAREAVSKTAESLRGVGLTS